MTDRHVSAASSSCQVNTAVGGAQKENDLPAFHGPFLALLTDFFLSSLRPLGNPPTAVCDYPEGGTSEASVRRKSF